VRDLGGEQEQQHDVPPRKVTGVGAGLRCTLYDPSADKAGFRAANGGGPSHEASASPEAAIGPDGQVRRPAIKQSRRRRPKPADAYDPAPSPATATTGALDVPRRQLPAVTAPGQGIKAGTLLL